MVQGPSKATESHRGGSRDFNEDTICRGVGGIKETDRGK